MHVIKRDGTRVPFNLSKWQAQIAKVCVGIADVSPSMIEIASQAHFRDGMSTRELDEIALKSMVNLIDEEENPYGNVNYQYVAGKQRITMLRKDVFGQYEVPRLYDIVKANVEVKLYTPDLLDWYTEAEWDTLQKYIDHDKDEALPYAAVEQLVEKYLIRNRSTGVVVETPQVRYMVAAATMFHMEKKDRLKYVRDFYEASSDGEFTLATPVLAGLGTKTKQFSSCVLLRTDDTLKSIFATGQVMADYASKRAGIGLEIGRVRPLGAPIREGEIMHTGLLPFLKKWYGDLRSCCLTPDTWVEVLEYGVPTRVQLNKLKIGSQIKTFDGNEIVYRTVTNVFDTIVPERDQVEIKFSNDTSLLCSINHPIMIMSKNGVEQKLPMVLEDELVISDDGGTQLTERRRGLHLDTRFIDITVEDTHTFFASSTRTGPMVLTHNSQGGVRNASATINLPIWHYQFDDFIVLKNNKGTEESRVRQLDYCVVMSKFFWKRFRNQENITFFDPNEVPDLYEAYYRDHREFERLYCKYEKRKDLRTKVFPAELVIKDWLMTERVETGRIYILNIDNVQDQGPFDPKIHPIYQTNLCVEIMQHTRTFQTLDDPDGRIALCTLGSNNWGSFKNPEEMRRPLRLLLRGLHNLLNYQDFMSMHSELHNREFEPIGVGVTNLAYWHAKRKLKYGDPDALAEVKRWIEHQSFYLTEMTVELAKEKGPCELSHLTRYGQGKFPWELRAEGVNELTDFTPDPNLNWELLRTDMVEYGVRNATTGALPPVESSSVVINSTNGPNMAKQLIVTKRSKAGDFVQVVPEYRKLKKHYQLLWDQPDCWGYIKTIAVLQAHTDQGISSDTPFNGANFKDGKVDINHVLAVHMKAIHWGLKSHYYSLSNKQATLEAVKAEEVAPVIEEVEEEYCESCVL